MSLASGDSFHKNYSSDSSISGRKGGSKRMDNNNTEDTASSSFNSYQEVMASINPSNLNVRNANLHFGDPEENLKSLGGDVTRHIQHQLENVAENSRRRTRSSSFSAYLSSRRGSKASDINVPGGFRREFLINKSQKENKAPPNFLARNFVELLTLYGNFAGENLDTDDESSTQEVFDEESSLLQNEVGRREHHKISESHTGTASVLKSYFLLFKALVGSGVLFLPRAFRNGGIIFSTITLVIFGFLTYMCYIILIKSKAILGKSSFGELGYATRGRLLRSCILVSIIISQIGFVSTYILFTAENLMSFLQGYLEIQNGYVTTKNIVILQCIFLIPLVLIRRIAKLSAVSLISSVFIIIGLLIIFYYSIQSLEQHGMGKDIVKFNPDTWSMLIGVAVTAFEGVGLIIPIESSMKQPEKFPQVLFVSLTIITGIFVSIGVIGYTAFGEQVKSIIILNLPQSSTAVQSISLLYSVAVFLSAPLQLFPATKILESLIFNSKFLGFKDGSKDEDGRLYHSSGKYNKNIKWAKNFVRAALISTICVLAYMNSNNLDKFISFNGCFACIPLVYIYPPLIHLKTYEIKKQESTGDMVLKAFDGIIIAIGSVVVVYTTYQILFVA